MGTILARVRGRVSGGSQIARRTSWGEGRSGSASTRYRTCLFLLTFILMSSYHSCLRVDSCSSYMPFPEVIAEA